MKNIFLILLALNVFVSCKTVVYKSESSNTNGFQSVAIDTLFQDKISIRAIQIDKNKIWYAADKGRYGFYDLDSHQKNENKITISLNLSANFLYGS